MSEAVTDPGTAALLELAGLVDGRRVLDLACGHGRVTRELIRRGGLDISDALLVRARAAEQVAPLGARYIHGDAAGSLELPAGSFDSVVCNYGLSDIDDLAGALANVHHLLRPGGASSSHCSPLPPQRWRSEHPDADPVPTFLAAHRIRLRAQPHDTILG
jgi:ubiquinone/menaquinone biosynthesis C-methylase UbiE